MADVANDSPITQERRLRIAAGSGVKVAEVNTLMNKFGKMQQMMGKMGGKMPGMRR